MNRLSFLLECVGHPVESRSTINYLDILPGNPLHTLLHMQHNKHFKCKMVLLNDEEVQRNKSYIEEGKITNTEVITIYDLLDGIQRGNLSDIDAITIYDYDLFKTAAYNLKRFIDEDLLNGLNKALIDNGILLVSHRVNLPTDYPKSLLDLIRYHADKYPDKHDKCIEVRRLLSGLSIACDHNRDLPIVRLHDVIDAMDDDELLYQYILSAELPTEFTSFVEMFKKMKFLYIADYMTNFMANDGLPSKILALLEKNDSIIANEQYLDLLNNRQIRHSLFIKTENIFTPFYAFDTSALNGKYVRCNATVDGIMNSYLNEEEQTIIIENAGTIKVKGMFLKACLKILGDAYPSFLSVDSLANAARQCLDMAGHKEIEGNQDDLNHLLMRIYIALNPSAIEFTDRKPNDKRSYLYDGLNYHLFNTYKKMVSMLGQTITFSGEEVTYFDAMLRGSDIVECFRGINDETSKKLLKLVKDHDLF